MLVPHEKLIRHFVAHAAAMYSRIVAISKGNISLTKLRDTLLPKLRTGELRILEVEKLVADCV